MPLTLPDLDDRSYADLIAEARSLIPALAPDWTDHNPADPGITLIELFAWLIEMLLYRINQVTDDNRLAFLRLLNGPKWQHDPKKSVDEEVRATVLALRRPARAVTAADFEYLALRVKGVARAHCLPRRYLATGQTYTENTKDEPTHVSVVVVPDAGYEPEELSQELCNRVLKELEPAQLLTTRLHVVSPITIEIGLALTVRTPARAWRRPDKVDAEATLTLTIHSGDEMHGERLLKAAEEALRSLLEPREGWAFGRDIYLSELYDCLSRLPGADYVTPTGTTPEIAAADSDRLGKTVFGLAAGELPKAKIFGLAPHELPKAKISGSEIILELLSGAAGAVEAN